jgi:glutaredoxin
MIHIYGNSICIYCKRAKNLSEKYDLEYVWKDVDEEQYMNEFKINFPGVTTLPQITRYGKHIGGYDEFAQEIENTMVNYGQDGF